jgi:hypothetical protein
MKPFLSPKALAMLTEHIARKVAIIAANRIIAPNQ